MGVHDSVKVREHQHDTFQGHIPIPSKASAPWGLGSFLFTNKAFTLTLSRATLGPGMSYDENTKETILLDTQVGYTTRLAPFFFFFNASLSVTKMVGL